MKIYELFTWKAYKGLLGKPINDTNEIFHMVINSCNALLEAE